MKAEFQVGILEGALANGWRGGDTPYRKDLPAGSVEWSRKDGVPVILRCICPCGCGTFHSLPVKEGYGNTIWRWDGDEVAPSLQPSVRMLTPCGWHGYLTKGEWKAV